MIRPGPDHLLDVAGKPRVRSEKDEERLGDDFMAKHGYEVIRLSQSRATMQTEGVSDRRYYHRGWKHAVWREAKREGGKQRARQRWFEELVTGCGEEYVCGAAAGLTPSA